MRTPTLRRNKAARELFALALVLSLFIQALVPSGWMPARSVVDGRITLSICSVGSRKTIVLDQKGGIIADDASEDPPNSQKERADQICPFASGHLLAQADLPIKAITFVASVSKHSGQNLDELATVVAYVGPPLGSRAPPSV